MPSISPLVRTGNLVQINNQINLAYLRQPLCAEFSHILFSAHSTQSLHLYASLFVMMNDMFIELILTVSPYSIYITILSALYIASVTNCVLSCVGSGGSVESCRSEATKLLQWHGTSLQPVCVAPVHTHVWCGNAMRAPRT